MFAPSDVSYVLALLACLLLVLGLLRLRGSVRSGSSLRRAAILLLVVGALLTLLGFAGVLVEGGAELRRKSALGEAMVCITVAGIVVFVIGLLVGSAALLKRKA